MDLQSRVHAAGSSAKKNYWRSILKEIKLARDPVSGRYSVRVESGQSELRTLLNEGGRGLELSELIEFGNRLLAFDDRTGVVFDVRSGVEAVPVYVLQNGDGETEKGFKTEWATVKDGILYVGGIGKEWTTRDGVVENYRPMWVKMIDERGHIEHVSWRHVYDKLRRFTGTDYPGYIIHEAVEWNVAERRWYFLPRRMSAEPYDDALDELRAANLLISTDEHFGDLQQRTVGVHNAARGFSSFKFVPHREREFVALKTEEYGERISSYIAVFDIDGNQLLEDTYIGDTKFEGIEFVDKQ
jgi:soluble calcium-activated nucleotidase 1